MPYISYQNRQISFKLVYFGPGMSGKTTNLSWIHRALAPTQKGEMIMLNTEQERTLFFDYFPLELGQVQGYDLRFNMYTVPGQTFYEASRRLVLEGADGVVFVADSNRDRMDDNVEMFERMIENFKHYDWEIEQFPLVVQYNKRDCGDPIQPGQVESALGLKPLPVFEAVATKGKGVMETVRALSQMVIQRFDL